jgi:hypothetical protein
VSITACLYVSKPDSIDGVHAIPVHSSKVRLQATLPPPTVRSAEECTGAAIVAGETLADMADYWDEALPEERRDIVWALLTLSGLVYDLERQAIVGLMPRDEMLPVLALGLADRWEQRDGSLWRRAAYLPPKRRRDNPHARLPKQYKLDYEQCARAREMVRAGRSMRQIAEHFGVSHIAVWRALHAEP